MRREAEIGMKRVAACGRGRSGGAAGGFTLMELLVVIGVLAVLMALLLPKLAGAKERAKRVLCMNNLRQFAAADTMYVSEYNELPPPSDFVPSSISVVRLGQMAATFRLEIPAGPPSGWPKRALQPKWINCPKAVESGIAEGMTLGGGLYTGYAYYGGIEESTMVKTGLATIENGGHAPDRRNTRRGVLWSDILSEYMTADPRRFEFYHAKPRGTYSDFRFFRDELEGIHRAWSDGSVEWLSKGELDLSGAGSVDLRIRHVLGNYYY